MLLLRAVAIGQRRDRLKDTTLAQYSADLERRLNRLLSGPEPTRPAARRLFRAMRRDRDDLFRFVCAPKGAFTLWVEVPPGQWSVGPVAGRRLGWVTGWV